MMRYRLFGNLLFIVMTLLGLAFSQLSLAKGSELKFDSAIQAISQTDSTEGTVTIIINGFEVPVLVNADTEIHLAGNEALLDELNVGDAVRIQAFFNDKGITAEEILVLQLREAHFRLHGTLTEVAEVESGEAVTETLTRIRLLGADVFVSSETRITQRGIGFGNAVPADNLTVGARVDVRGHFDEQLMADRIHIGSRQLGKIELEGEVISSSESQLTVMLEDGGEVTVVTDDQTEISGEIEVGVFVEIEGMLNAELAVVATEIVVDTDGDGDADDNNSRRPVIDLPDVVTSRFSTTLMPVDTESALSGRAKLIFPPVEKTMEIEVEGAEAGTQMSVHVLAADSVLDLGTVVADEDGEIDAELPVPLDGEVGLGEISEIELSVDGTVVLRGNF